MQTDRQTEGDRNTIYRDRDGETEIQTCRQTDRHTDTQTHRHTDRQTVSVVQMTVVPSQENLNRAVAVTMQQPEHFSQLVPIVHRQTRITTVRGKIG